MDRAQEFLGDRLRGRKVPDDLRRLVWLYPDEPADVRPPIVKLTSEGEFSVLGGSLIEAMAFDRDEDRDVSELAGYRERHRIPFTLQSSAEVHRFKPVMEPATLHEKLFERLRPKPQD